MKLKNVTIINCDTGISAPAGAHIEADGLNISECQKAIEVRDQPTLMQQLGLAPETPASELIAVLSQINGKDPSQEDVASAVESSALVSWLSAGANITTLVGGIYQMAQSGLVQSVLSMLPR